MDFFLGIRGPKHGFVMLCADTAATQQIITIKHDEDKLVALDGRTVMALSGEKEKERRERERAGLCVARVRRSGGGPGRVPERGGDRWTWGARARAPKREGQRSPWALRSKRAPLSQPPLSPSLLGEPGDRVQFSEFIAANVRLHALRTETRLSTSAVAHYTRGELATALRKVR